MVEDGAFSHKIDYVTIFLEFLILEGHLNYITGSKVTADVVDFSYPWSCIGKGLHLHLHLHLHLVSNIDDVQNYLIFSLWLS